MPSDLADASVIVPAYRAGATIGRALESIAAQTLRPREVIVVDDGSDDDTFEAARSRTGAMRDISLKVFRQANQGAGAARNRALGEASGYYVAFLDADDEWLPKKLARSLSCLEDTDRVLVAHNYLLFENGTDRVIDTARRFREAGTPFVGLYRKGYIGTCTVVARRDAVLAAGGFDSTLLAAQDFDLWLTMLGKPGARFEVFDEALSRYHISQGGITSQTDRRLKCCLEIARRHAPALKAHPGSVLASLWFRIIAVHYEAVAVYLERKDSASALMTCLRLPVNLFVLSMAALFGRQVNRKTQAS